MTSGADGFRVASDRARRGYRRCPSHPRRDGGGAGECVSWTSLADVERRRVQTFDQLRSHAVFTFAGAAAEPLDDGDRDRGHWRTPGPRRDPPAFEQVWVGALVEWRRRTRSTSSLGRLIGATRPSSTAFTDMFTETGFARSNAYRVHGHRTGRPFRAPWPPRPIARPPPPTLRPLRTSRFMAVSASPGKRTPTSTSGGPACWRTPWPEPAFGRPAGRCGRPHRSAMN